AELRDYMHVQDAHSLVDYLARFETTLRLMQTADALERIAYELAEDAARENVRYMEVRYSPVLHTEKGMPATEAVEAPLRGLRRDRAVRRGGRAAMECMSPVKNASLCFFAG